MHDDAHSSIEEPSAWVRHWAVRIPAAGRVLDVACGSGRHLRWFAERGARVTGLDRDAAAVAASQGLGRVLVADLERGPWPLAGERFDAVVVTNYLWRPLMPSLLASLADGGVLIYETFALGNEAFGRPSNPDFLLRPGELLDVCRGLHVVAYEDGVEGAPLRRVQRIVAMNSAAADARHRL